VVLIEALLRLIMFLIIFAYVIIWAFTIIFWTWTLLFLLTLVGLKNWGDLTWSLYFRKLLLKGCLDFLHQDWLLIFYTLFTAVLSLFFWFIWFLLCVLIDYRYLVVGNSIVKLVESLVFDFHLVLSFIGVAGILREVNLPVWVIFPGCPVFIYW
jgi:hypothetical protein